MARGQPTVAHRLASLLQKGGYSKVTIVYDERDGPQPWTVELHVRGRLVGIRYAATLQQAITAVQSIRSEA